jgi:hypothetical protein
MMARQTYEALVTATYLGSPLWLFVRMSTEITPELSITDLMGILVFI